MNLSNATEAKAEVKEVLAQSPRQYNLEQTRWDLNGLQQAIDWLHDKSSAGVWKILKRLGFSYKQAALFIQSPDPHFRPKQRAISRAFAHSMWHPDEAVILFHDELTYYLTPTLAQAWGVSGSKQPTVSKSPGRDKMTRIGAMMNGVTGRVHFRQGAKFGMEAMKRLYRDTRQLYDQPMLYVVQDNCSSIHKHPTVFQCASKLNITPLFLPTYASWLNPIEKLWRWLKSDVLHNHPWSHDLNQLRRETAAFLDRFRQPSHDLLRYVGLLPD